MNSSNPPTLLQYLSEYAPEGKKELFKKLIENRTRHITVVVEDIFQSHNASAVLRSCDCFGVQDVHIIENQHKYNVNPDVSLGSSKWLDIKKYNNKSNNTKACFDHLKADGYKIYATTPHKNDYSLYDVPIEEKVAIVFGTEKNGLSELAMNQADGYLRIPMYGFTESFNISVSAALCLYELTKRLRQSDLKWKLTQDEIYHVLLNWTKNSIKSSEFLIKKYHEIYQ